MGRISCGQWIDAFVTAGLAGGGSVSGDCVLLDFHNRFFAVADGSGRSPGFSKDLLLEISAALEAVKMETCFDLCVEIEKLINSILNNLYGIGSSTMTGLFIPDFIEFGLAIMLHMGDSFLATIEGDKLERVSKTNFWMAGKSLKIHQVQPIAAVDNTIVVIGSDGFMDLVNGNGPSFDEFCTMLSRACDQSTVVDALYQSALLDPVHDDVSLVVFRPCRVEYNPKKIVLGGMANGDLDKRVASSAANIIMIQ